MTTSKMIKMLRDSDFVKQIVHTCMILLHKEHELRDAVSSFVDNT